MDDLNGIKQLDVDDRNETVESKIIRINYLIKKFYMK